MLKFKEKKRALDYFELFWSNIECGITIIDAETREIIDINPLAAQMFGADKSQIIGKTCHKLLCPADRHACPIMDDNQVVDRSERKFIRANGEIIPIIKSVKKITLDGRLVLLESFTDISPLKLADDMMRTLEIYKKVNNEKADLLSNMSDKLRAPIDSIIDMTSVGKSSDDKEQKDIAFKTIEEEAANLRKLIQEILEHAKSEAGNTDLPQEPSR